jgi:asparagine synthase (glutamine-hydrolysing)
MSIQFGRCNFDGKAVGSTVLDEVRPLLTPYGPDGEGSLCNDNVGILYRAFHTTRESTGETQPQVSKSGSVITWDGRLDNREELIDQLGERLSPESTDLDIVAAAYDRWDIDAFARLIGDWALSVWDPKDRSLTLAKDFVGTRHLYYSVEKDQVTWCTILDPLVRFAGRTFKLEQEYIAGWLTLFPAPHLTPYAGINSVPPCSFVRLTKRAQTEKKYWEFDSAKTICYRSDPEYEEHFRIVFANSVRRRLRSHSPVLAELSGGMDSSAIVCMADDLTSRGLAAEAPGVETLSYYDDSEPNWNERPYFTIVEQRRGRTGCHVDVGAQSPLEFDSRDGHFGFTPGSAHSCDDITGRFVACLRSGGHRVVLSGIGGDEVTGGVPTPMPELADLLATCRLRKLAHQLRTWALQKRQPWWRLLFETGKEFLPVSLVGIPEHRRPAAWLSPRFIDQHRGALIGYEPRLKVFGPSPSFQLNLNTVDALRRQLACTALPSSPSYERRYPYLDRSLLEFLFAIPQEQLLRPGQRRSLMRRALAGIVPDEILNRKRKAYVSTGLIKNISAQWGNLNKASDQLVCGALGIVESESILDAIQGVVRDAEAPTLTLMRALTMESWLRAALKRGVLDGLVM